MYLAHAAGEWSLGDVDFSLGLFGAMSRISLLTRHLVSHLESAGARSGVKLWVQNSVFGDRCSGGIAAETVRWLAAMRQKPLQWLLGRVLAGNSQGVGSRVWSGGRSGGAAAESAPIRVLSFCGDGKGLESVKVPWDFRSCRAYAAPVAAAGSGKAGSGDGKDKAERKINRAIVARMIRLVGDDGHEVLSRYEALNRAQQAGLDLVEVDGKADPPVCKLMDFSKERFKVKKQEKDLRKKQLERRRLDDLKEVRFSSRTEQKDLEMKAETVTRLLVRGHRVKLAVQFHGNDKGEEVGVELLERALALLQAEVKVENGPRVEKMRAWVLIRPILEQKTGKKKASKIRQENVNEDNDSEVSKGVQA